MRYQYEIYYEYESSERPSEVVDEAYSMKEAKEYYEQHRRRPTDWWDDKFIVRIRRRPLGEWEVVR